MGNIKDYGTSLIATAPSPATSGTSLVVTTGHGYRFPDAPFDVTVHPHNEIPTLDNSEKLTVTNKSGDVFTITRAQGDTNAKSIADGWRITNALFKGDLDAKEDKYRVSVKDFGAKGDDSTDDTLAIQAAIDSVDVSGGEVFFPRGIYRISASIVLKSGLSLVGEGTQATIIKQTSTSDDGMTGADVHYLTIRNMGIVGPGSGTGNGIKLVMSLDPDLHYHEYHNLELNMWGANGLDLQNPIVTTIHRVLAIENGGIGFHIHGTSGVPGTSTNFISTYAILNDIGYLIDTMSYLSFLGTATDKNNIGYRLKSCYGISMNGSGAELNNIDFDIDGGKAISIIGSFSYSNKDKVVNVYGGTEELLLSNIIQSLPDAGATNFMNIIGGVKPTIIGCFGTLPNNIPGGVTLRTNAGDLISDGALTGGSLVSNGGLTVASNVYTAGDNQTDGSINASSVLSGGSITSNGSITTNGSSFQAIDANETDYLRMYHSEGLYAQLEGSNKFVLTAPNGTNITNSLDVQDTTSWNSIKFSADGSSGKITTGWGDISVDSKKIINAANPTSDQDVATKKYVDDEIAAVPAPSYPVTSVAGKTGTVTLAKADVGLGNVDNTSNATERAATATLTNKRVNPRVLSAASASTVTPTIATYDQYVYTALAANLTINAPTGTPVTGNKLMFVIKDNGTSRTLTWNAAFAPAGVDMPTSTTAGKWHYVGFIYNSAAAKWHCIASTEEG